MFGLTHCIGGRITATLSDRAQCPDGHGLDPAKTGCWPVNCRPGFDRIGATCTRKSYQPQSRSVKSSVLQCKSDEDNISGLCYSKNNRGCRSGYTMGNEHLGICSVNCPPGTQSTGPVTCTRESYSRGAGHPPPRKIPFSTKYN